MKTNTQIITRELAEQNDLYFYPSVRNDAEQLLKKLCDLGFLWGNTQTRDVSQDAIQRVLDKGIIILGKPAGGYLSGIYTADYFSGRKENGLLCTLDQFSSATAPVPTSEVLEEFRAVRAELTALRAESAEMRKELADIKASIAPAKVEKTKGQTL